MVAVNRPILGADFLLHHHFDVSLACHLLVSVNGVVRLPLMSSSLPSNLLSKVSVEYHKILVEFPEIVGLGFTLSPVKHDVRHHVETNAHLHVSPPLGPTKVHRATAKAEFEKMEKAGIVKQSNLP